MMRFVHLAANGCDRAVAAAAVVVVVVVVDDAAGWDVHRYLLVMALLCRTCLDKRAVIATAAGA